MGRRGLALFGLALRARLLFHLSPATSHFHRLAAVVLSHARHHAPDDPMPSSAWTITRESIRRTLERLER
jgi:hypothetical protein